jgi:death-on-curing family protein
MINKIEFSARNLTSNAGLFLLLEHANKNGVFDLIENDLIFENASTNKIKMNHIKTMHCGNFVGIDKLERLKLLQSDPLIKEFNISIKEPETVSRFLGNFSYRTTQMQRALSGLVYQSRRADGFAINNHPFLDGNKRTGITATGLFFRINGWKLTASSKELVACTMRVAVEGLEIDELANWLRAKTIKSK